MSFLNLQWYGWLCLFFAITSTAGATAQLAIDLTKLHAGKLDKISFNFLWPAIFILATLVGMTP